jgi:hypothetical protein
LIETEKDKDYKLLFYFNYSFYLCGMENNEEIKLTPVLGSSNCQFSVIENKLKIIYENQEKILLAIKLLSKQNEK